MTAPGDQSWGRPRAYEREGRMSLPTIREAREALMPFARLFADVDTSRDPDEQHYVIENAKGHGSYVRPWSGDKCGFTVADIRRVLDFMRRGKP